MLAPKHFFDLPFGHIKDSITSSYLSLRVWFGPMMATRR